MASRENHDAACDVCGRTLLRGERAEIFIDAGTRKAVCELCKPRALHEGWLREGTVPAYDERVAPAERRSSLFGRLRGRREAARTAAPTLADELDHQSWSEARSETLPPRREPRHVRAVPTSDEQKIVSAIELFNGSEHPRTVAGVARSLGGPVVSVLPSGGRPSLVHVAVSWELCWYRYEVDLADESSNVRLVGQGAELEELSSQEREPNAVCDDRGSLSLAS